jgi:4-hydroxy-tetrahydrodipicolinate synthase
VTGVPVLAGTGAAWGPHAAELTARARDGGADGALVLSPPRVADPRPYYEAVARAAGELPVLAYHFPATAPPGIPIEVLPDLPVAGMKDSSGDPDRLLAELEPFPGALYVGSSALLALAGPLGCDGAILALANAEPERCAEAFTGDGLAQRALAEPHLASRRAFPHGIKELTAARFGTSTTSRQG